MSEYTPTIEEMRAFYTAERLDGPHLEGFPEPTVEQAEAEFDRWLSEVRASVVAEEPEWEYGTRCPMPECTEPHLLDESDAPPQPEESLWRRTRERHVPPGEWVPVKQEGAHHA